MRKKKTEAILCIVFAIALGILFLIQYSKLNYDIIWIWPIIGAVWMIKGVVMLVKLKKEKEQKNEE